jgi:hypothetical protein
MHHRVTAWVWASCAAPAVLMLTSAAAAVGGWPGFGVLLQVVVWRGVVAFLLLASSLVLFSPVLLLPLERRKLSSRWTTVVMAAAVIVGGSFTASLIIGPLHLSILLGALLDAAVFLLILQRLNNKIEGDGLPAPRPFP